MGGGHSGSQGLRTVGDVALHDSHQHRHHFEEMTSEFNVTFNPKFRKQSMSLVSETALSNGCFAALSEMPLLPLP
jgi:hypothetical protein